MEAGYSRPFPEMPIFYNVGKGEAVQTGGIQESGVSATQF